MNESAALPYLAIVKQALGDNLKPGAAPEMQQMTAMCGHRILARLVANTQHLPELRARSLAGYRAMLADLKPLLRDGEEGALLAELEAQLHGQAAWNDIERSMQQVVAALARKGDAASPALRQIAGIEHRLQSDFLDAYNAAMTQAPSGAGDKGVFTAAQSERLIEWLRNTFPGNDRLRIVGTKTIPGGFSKQTIFVSLDNASGLPPTVVIRLDWTDSPVGTTVVDEFHIIKTLFEAGVAVPRPYALEESGAVLGGPFLLLSKIDGGNIGDALDVTGGSRAFAASLAQTLAKLHAIAPAAFGDRVAGAQESTKERMLREIASFESGWRALGEASVALEIAFAWLKRNIALADGARSLIHKDVGCHNMLAKNDRLAALLDWETAAIGNPAQDLGYAYPTVVQMCPWDDFIAAYAAAGGTPPPPREQVDYYTLWGYTWLNVMLMQARAAFASGGANDIRLGYAGAYLLARLQARLAEQLNALV